jgi:DNA-binding MarR family transcriptional regulator
LLETVRTRSELAEQLDQIQHELERLRSMLLDFDPSSPCDDVSPHWIRSIIKARRRREQIFGDDIFADPGWDILLELYAAALAQDPVTVTQVCKVATIPTTTGLRWLGQLEQAGWISREPDTKDRRRVFLTLTSAGLKAMRQYFEIDGSRAVAV